MMGSRAGSIDPGIVLELLRRDRLTVPQLADVLDHGSGLLGVSGRTADVRVLLAAEAEGDASAALALELFVRRAAAGIAASATALSHVDAVVFTGGIGEHSGPLRQRIVGRLSVLGLPAISDATVESDGRLGLRGDGPTVLRVEAREDLVVAGTVRATLRGD
jgi:acetate kinase